MIKKHKWDWFLYIICNVIYFHPFFINYDTRIHVMTNSRLWFKTNYLRWDMLNICRMKYMPYAYIKSQCSTVTLKHGHLQSIIYNNITIDVRDVCEWVTTTYYKIRATTIRITVKKCRELYLIARSFPSIEQHWAVTGVHF